MLRNRLLLLLLAFALFGVSCQRNQGNPSTVVVDPHKYYAVLLANGSVYFGHLEGLGSSYPVLSDVFYVQSSVNQETKAVSNILVKRGKEWHGPDKMFINEKSIVFVEPVGANSKVAQLIQEAGGK